LGVFGLLPALVLNLFAKQSALFSLPLQTNTLQVNPLLFPASNTQLTYCTMSESPELAAQNAKFGTKKPESVYQKHKPGMTAQGASRIAMHRDIIIFTGYWLAVTFDLPAF